MFFNGYCLVRDAINFSVGGRSGFKSAILALPSPDFEIFHATEPSLIGRSMNTEECGV